MNGNILRNTLVISAGVVILNSCGGSGGGTSLPATQPLSQTLISPEAYQGTYNINIPFAAAALATKKITSDSSGVIRQTNSQEIAYTISAGSVDAQGNIAITFNYTDTYQNSAGKTLTALFVYDFKGRVDSKGDVTGTFTRTAPTDSSISNYPMSGSFTGTKTFEDVAGEWQTTNGNIFSIDTNGVVSGLKLAATTSGTCYGSVSGGVSTFADPNPLAVNEIIPAFQLPKLRNSYIDILTPITTAFDTRIVNANFINEGGFYKFGGDIRLSYLHKTNYTCSGSLNTTWRSQIYNKSIKTN